ncbi:acyltransferase family protein [Streptomyces sp. TRM S81-3]|uniref:Acyltransferase family protein n=1 Tax=Streptomyces griseicoloratus TaxID=2752516 RepID=A0A926L4H8_9ACTN|nr:acyltransferase family protein [Streptomyces griseicoloratus]MBD0421790.1 acyltransferase family protein [Streptomyces griseicoloratus]
MPGLRELAERTPPRRERHVDLLRAVAIVIVVLGHWMVIVVTGANGGVDGFSALEVLSWGRPITWLVQVMPVFFIVGGFANAASLASHTRAGKAVDDWLLDRSARLVRPTTALLVTLAAAALIARTAGVDPAQVGRAVWLASIPLWFLLVYLVVVFLTPLMHRLHRRAGLAVPLVLVVLVAAGDVARLAFDAAALQLGNYLFAWLAVHQTGFAWQDGTLPVRPGVAVPLFTGGAAAAVLLTVAGPYPVSMVDVPGTSFRNLSPPTLALLALATAQLGLALLLRDAGERRLRRLGPWMAVIAVNTVIMTVLLWHMSAFVVVAVTVYATGLFPLPRPPGATEAWLLWKLPWLAVLSVVLGAFVAVFGRIERRGPRRGAAASRSRWTPRALGRPRLRATVTTLGYAAAVLGLLGVAVAGPADHGPLGLPAAALAVFLAGAALLRAARAAPTGRGVADPDGRTGP